MKDRAHILSRVKGLRSAGGGVALGRYVGPENFRGGAGNGLVATVLLFMN